MKQIILLLALLIPVCALGQESQNVQDPAAGKVLERVSAKFKSLQSIQTDFELIITDRKENTRNASAGKLTMKQSKYKLDGEGSTVYFDGATMWTYISANNEVTITEPENSSPDFMSNPATFFNTYKSEFKYRYVGEVTKNSVSCHEIDLFPKNLNQPYSRIKVFVNTTSDLPEVISSIGKDGIDYTVSLKNLALNKEFPDSFFTFDPSKYRKVEVVDMRGI